MTDSRTSLASAEAERTIDLFGVEVELTPVMLKIPGKLDDEKFERLFTGLKYMNRGCQFWIGDCVAEGIIQLGEDRATQIMGYTDATYANWARVCRSYTEEQRYESLPFTFHRAVYSLPPDRRQPILEAAAAQGLSSRDVEDRAREARRELNNQHPSSEPEGAGEVRSAEDEVEVVSKECPTCGGRGIIEERGD